MLSENLKLKDEIYENKILLLYMLILLDCQLKQKILYWEKKSYLSFVSMICLSFS